MAQRGPVTQLKEGKTTLAVGKLNMIEIENEMELLEHTVGEAFIWRNWHKHPLHPPTPCAMSNHCHEWIICKDTFWHLCPLLWINVCKFYFLVWKCLSSKIHSAMTERFKNDKACFIKAIYFPGAHTHTHTDTLKSYKRERKPSAQNTDGHFEQLCWLSALFWSHACKSCWGVWNAGISSVIRLTSVEWSAFIDWWFNPSFFQTIRTKTNTLNFTG